MGQSTITLTGDGLQAAQAWNIEIAVEATVNLDARAARQKVTGWLVDNVGNMIIGDAPRLVIGQRTVWRVPALLTSAHRGIVGEIGVVDVNAETGELVLATNMVERLLEDARIVASSAPAPVG